MPHTASRTASRLALVTVAFGVAHATEAPRLRSAAEPNPDALLISLCFSFNATERRIQALDRSGLDGLLGTVAGDDTMLCIATEHLGGAGLASFLRELAGIETGNGQ